MMKLKRSEVLTGFQTVGTVGKTTLATSNPDTENVPSQNETAEKVHFSLSSPKDVFGCI